MTASDVPSDSKVRDHPFKIGALVVGANIYIL